MDAPARRAARAMANDTEFDMEIGCVFAKRLHTVAVNKTDLGMLDVTISGLDAKMTTPKRKQKPGKKTLHRKEELVGSSSFQPRVFPLTFLAFQADTIFRRFSNFIIKCRPGNGSTLIHMTTSKHILRAVKEVENYLLLCALFVPLPFRFSAKPAPCVCALHLFACRVFWNWKWLVVLRHREQTTSESQHCQRARTLLLQT